MGHHLTDDGQFKSDRHPDLPAGKIILSFKDVNAQLGLWVTAIEYQDADAELSGDIMQALRVAGFKPPRDDDGGAYIQVGVDHIVTPASGRPDFAGFLAALRGDYRWSDELNTKAKVAPAAAHSALNELAEHVERVGKKLGFLP